MVNTSFRNEYGGSTPVNSLYQILAHPSGNNTKSIELGLFNEHRYAFYYWIKWNLENNVSNNPPDLISFDWHQDLAYPHEEEQEELKRLDLKNLTEVSIYSWMRLNSLNDNHILSAAYLNQIGDIWVVCKQEPFFGSCENETIKDLNGKVHTMRKFKTKDELYAKLIKTEIQQIYFDIDLDYFTIENSTSNGDQKFTYVKDKEIAEMFDIASDFMQWCFERMDGFTIALEPEHTGGIKKSLKYLALLNKIFFEGEIHHWDCNWKHL